MTALAFVLAVMIGAMGATLFMRLLGMIWCYIRRKYIQGGRRN